LTQSSLRLKTVFDAVNRTPLQLLADLDIDRSVPESAHFKGGYTHARERLQTFISRKLNNYDKLRNDPTCDYVSGLSPYLHFGQISP
jgi:deoxyribodipyrimidine photo-lyase